MNQTPDYLHFQVGRLQNLEGMRDLIIQEALAAGRTAEEAPADADRMLAKVQRERVWVSGLYQLHVDDDGETVHYSLKRKDKGPLFARTHLVDIAQRFCRDRRRLPVEIYPMASHVVDTANQYHIWAPPLRRAMGEAAVRIALEQPGVVVDLHDRTRVLHIPLGSERDWRLVQAQKNEILGIDCDAVDLLLPATREAGPVLLALEPGYHLQFGWRGGCTIDRSHSYVGAVQRALASP